MRDSARGGGRWRRRCADAAIEPRDGDATRRTPIIRGGQWRQCVLTAAADNGALKRQRQRGKEAVARIKRHVLLLGREKKVKEPNKYH